MTGFQRGVYKNKDDMLKIFSQTMKSDEKTIEFVQTRLRSAKEIYTGGGHVTTQYRDQLFRMQFDNKRLIETKGSNVDFLDSSPVESVKQCENLRFISKQPKLKQYSKFSNLNCDSTKYKKQEDVVVKNFLKGLLSSPPLFNLNRQGLESYESIVRYIKDFDPLFKLTEYNLAVLRQRCITIKSVPRTKGCEVFIEFIKLRFPRFDEELFFRT